MINELDYNLAKGFGFSTKFEKGYAIFPQNREMGTGFRIKFLI